MAQAILKNTKLWRTARTARARTNQALIGTATRFAILPRPFHLVVIAGLKRSGNHVFANWYLSQAHGPCAFFNHVRPHQYPTERFRREFRINQWRAVPTVVFSYEDRRFANISSGPLRDFISRHKDQIQSQTLCLILRDPRNLMASRFRKWPEEHADPDRADTVMDLWRHYADHAVAGHSPVQGFDMVPIYYNLFITDPVYRKGLSAALEIRDGIRGLDQVTAYGHGSSFSGTDQLDTKSLFERWKHYEDDPAFQRLFSDGTVEDLAQRLEAS